MIRTLIPAPLRRAARHCRTQLRNRRSITKLRWTGHPLAPTVADAIVGWQRGRPLAEDRIDAVERQREQWLQNNTPLSEIASGFNARDSISRACRASLEPAWCPLMFHLARSLRPHTTLELGTNLGISSAYLATACRAHDGRVLTMEGSPARQALAKSLHAELQLDNIHYQLGKFQDELPQVLEQFQPIELAFIDGHHQIKPTLEYVDAIYPAVRNPAVIVFDDICWSDDMIRAWEELCQDSRFEVMVSIGNIGIALTQEKVANRKPAVIEIIAKPG